jgi:hypothetical protein
MLYLPSYGAINVESADTPKVFNFKKFDDYITGRTNSQEVDLTLRSQNRNMMMPLTSMHDLMGEFMTAMSLNHGCIRVSKK